MIPYLVVCPLVFVAALVDSIAGGGGLIEKTGTMPQGKVFAICIAALVTFIATGNVYYPLGLAAGACSIAGRYIGAGLVAHNGKKVVRPVVLLVLAVLFIKILSGN